MIDPSAGGLLAAATTAAAAAAADDAFTLAALSDSPMVVLAIQWGLRIAYAALILGVGLWMAFFISGQVAKRLSAAPRIDPTLGKFFGTVTRYILVVIVLIAVLQKFGVQTTSLVAMLGAATLAIGLALQGALGDLAAGIIIIVFRPYRIGDFVEIGGKGGTVDDISLFYTALNTIDNRRITIPNGMAWGDAIENYTHNPVRRIDLTVGISYSDDIDHAIGVVLETIADFGDIHKDPEPQVAVRGLGDSSVDLVVRCWTDTGIYMGTVWELTKRIKLAFDANGVSIPFPHQVSINRIETEDGGDKPAQGILIATGQMPAPGDVAGQSGGRGGSDDQTPEDGGGSHAANRGGE